MKRLRSREPGRQKILHYLGVTEEIGGTETQVLTLCEQLLNHHSVMIACTTARRAEFVQQARSAGISVHALPGTERDMATYLRRTLVLTRLLRRADVDVIHIHTTGYGGLSALIAAWLAGIRAVVVTHHGWFATPSGTLARRLSLWLERRTAKQVIALYKLQAQELTAAGIPPERITVVPVGVALRRVDPAHERSADDAPNEIPFRVCIVARIASGKGHAELLQAIRQLAPRYPQLRLRVVGDGPLRSSVEHQINELGLGDVVELMGWIPNDQISAILRSSHAIVLPSYMPGEALPVALIEGMALGLPAIGTRWKGIADIIVDGETGLLVEPRDIESLARAIEQLARDPLRASEMGQKGQERARRVFAAEVIAKTHLSLYRTAVARHPPRRI